MIGLLVAVGWLFQVVQAGEDRGLRAAFGTRDITPAVEGTKPVFLAGYGMNRRATGVHDPLFARCVTLDDGQRRMSFVSVDLVGLQYPTVQRIRAGLSEWDYVLVASTHNHEAPDVVGIWGASPVDRGVDDAYEQLVVTRVQELVRGTLNELVPVQVAYGMAEDASLLGDSRLPTVKDGILRLLRFTHAETGQAVGLWVQWNCHPEALGSRNTLVTSDFPAATIEALEAKEHGKVAYFSGALGGLMAPPRDRIRDASGQVMGDGTFDYAWRYGQAVAELAERAVVTAEPIRLAPLAVSAKAIGVPVENLYYQTARTLGVLRRPSRQWQGDFEQLGPVVTPDQVSLTTAVETEVAYLRLGELAIAAIPGEIYPELVYGQFQEPVEPNVDFPAAPLEKPVVQILPEKRWLLFGLANDEIGYIIPRRQWDAVAPFAYARLKSQYGEINSCGANVAPIIMRALENRVRALQEVSE
jgi:hypothetical protein